MGASITQSKIVELSSDDFFGEPNRCSDSYPIRTEPINKVTGYAGCPTIYEYLPGNNNFSVTASSDRPAAGNYSGVLQFAVPV